MKICQRVSWRCIKIIKGISSQQMRSMHTMGLVLLSSFSALLVTSRRTNLYRWGIRCIDENMQKNHTISKVKFYQMSL